MNLVREQDAFMIHVRKLIQKANQNGFLVTGGELFRTAEQQAIHVKNGRSRTNTSQHMKRLAIDLNFFMENADGSLTLEYKADALRELGDYWESLHPQNRWGGNWNNFKDTPHFERREKDSASEESRPSVTTQRKILASAVGVNSPNLRDDVETVQRLLNLSVTDGRFQTDAPLTTDGIFGKNTLAAIFSFQRAALAMTEPDGVISPTGPTIAALVAPLIGKIDQKTISLVYLKAAQEELNEISPLIVSTMSKRAIDTPLRRSHFLAQIGHESGELRFKEEIAGGQAYEGREDLGNTEPGDGKRFKGRGLIQLTGRANYTAYAKSINREEEILKNPKIISEDPELCVDVAGWYWEKRGLNLAADRDDLEAVTRKINGGLNGLANRRRLLERSKSFIAV